MGLKGNLAGALSIALKEWARDRIAALPPHERVLVRDVIGTPHQGEMEAVLAKAYDLAGTDGCFVKAGNAEPLFVLRAQDKLAAAIVEEWAIAADRNGVNKEKVADAARQGDVFREWRMKHGSKVPD